MTEPTTEPLARPLVRLDFFPQTVLLTRFGEGHSQTCYPVAVEDVAGVFTDVRLATGLLPRETLFWQKQGDVTTLAIYVPARRWQVPWQGEKTYQLPLSLSSCVFCASMRPQEVDELYPEELWLIVILEAHAQVNLHTIRGLWGHGERMTEYIVRRGLLLQPLVDEVWQKWSAPERPAEMFEGNRADEVLFTEVRRLTALSG